MKTKSNQYEYFYQSAELGHHHQYLTRPLLEMISQWASDLTYKPRILDIGSGNGSLTQLLSQAGYEVIGVEPSESGIELAQKSYPECNFIQADINNFPIEKFQHSFDLVIAVEVIEHLYSPRELLKVASQCLKPNGKIIVTTPYHGYFKNLVLALLGKMDKHFTALWDGGHIKFFSVVTLTSLLQQERYENIQFKFAGRYPFLWKTMLCSSSPVSEKN